MNTLAGHHEATPNKLRNLGQPRTVADRLGVPVSTLYEMARQNRIAGVVRVGRLVRFDMDKLEEWIDSGGQALPGGWRQEEAE